MMISPFLKEQIFLMMKLEGFKNVPELFQYS